MLIVQSGRRAGKAATQQFVERIYADLEEPLALALERLEIHMLTIACLCEQGHPCPLPGPHPRGGRRCDWSRNRVHNERRALSSLGSERPVGRWARKVARHVLRQYGVTGPVALLSDRKTRGRYPGAIVTARAQPGRAPLDRPLGPGSAGELNTDNPNVLRMQIDAIEFIDRRRRRARG